MPRTKSSKKTVKNEVKKQPQPDGEEPAPVVLSPDPAAPAAPAAAPEPAAAVEAAESIGDITETTANIQDTVKRGRGNNREKIADGDIRLQIRVSPKVGQILMAAAEMRRCPVGNYAAALLTEWTFSHPDGK